MRKILFFAALAVFAMTSINAQEETSKEINFGVKAGVNFTNIHTRGGSNGASGNIGNAKTGFHIVAVAEIMLNRRFALQDICFKRYI
tara:strand:- start:620 stop:880 length:261 start_codon:yes stop_codon:yes gene_type:complete